MITIVEPKKHIADLWGQQRVKQEATFRQMRYVLRVDHEGKVLLHNVVTGQLVVLSQEEAEVIQALPSSYAPVMEGLIKAHYLVPEDYDEHRQVINLRTILRKLEASCHSTHITHYIILPTTACNARCYYCYQQGIPTEYMSEQTANQVIDYICNQCGDKKQITITWFGGEPTIAVNRINQICNGLCKENVHFRSVMISNGLLFDVSIVEQAKTLWNLKQVTITIDGTEKTYNQTKAYTNYPNSPYQRVMQNIALLLNNGIAVKIRMNYDLGNWKEYADLVEEVVSRFPDKRLLEMTAHRILGEHLSTDGKLYHGEETWFEEKNVELGAITRDVGLSKKSYGLPFLRFEACGAANDSTAVITPQGNLVSCPDQLEVDQIKGNIWKGVNNDALVAKWRQFVEFSKCADCYFMPSCVHMFCCNAQDNCASRKELYLLSTIEMREKYYSWVEKAGKMEV